MKITKATGKKNKYTMTFDDDYLIRLYLALPDYMQDLKDQLQEKLNDYEEDDAIINIESMRK